jgi:hypothetical protein
MSVMEIGTHRGVAYLFRVKIWDTYQPCNMGTRSAERALTAAMGSVLESVLDMSLSSLAFSGSA